MANANGRIYIDTETTPNTGVSVHDIQVVLGRGTCDVGLLCSDQEWYNNGGAQALRRVNKINKWAKYKPIKRSGRDFSDQLDTDKTWKSTATWWKGTDGQCGLTFATFESLYTGNAPFASGSFLQKLKDGELPWGYDTPTGGINSFPFRMMDFNQYFHNAPKPVIGVFDNLRLYGGGKLTVQLDENRGDNLSIQLSDITIGNSSVSGWYVGVLIWMSNSSGEYTFAFSENTIGGNGDLNVEFSNMTTFGGRNVTVVPFLSSVRSNQGVNPGEGVFLSCDVAPQTVTIAAETAGVQTTIDAQWKDQLYVRVGYDVNIINNTDSSITVTNLVIDLYDGSQVVDSDTVASVTIPARENKSYTGTLIADPYVPSATYKVRVASDYQGVSGEVVVDEPRRT